METFGIISLYRFFSPTVNSARNAVGKIYKNKTVTSATFFAPPKIATRKNHCVPPPRNGYVGLAETKVLERSETKNEKLAKKNNEQISIFPTVSRE